MRQVEFAALVQSLHESFIDLVAAVVSKADETEENGCGDLEVFVFAHPIGELLRELDVTANVVLKPSDAIVADDKPEFECAKTAAELNVPVAIVDDLARASP